GNCDSWTDTTVIWVVGILHMQVPGGFESQNGSIGRTLERGRFTLRQELIGVNQTSVRKHKFNLSAIFLNWRHLDCVTETIVDRQRGLEAPGVRHIHVVGGDGADLLGQSAQRLKRKI